MKRRNRRCTSRGTRRGHSRRRCSKWRHNRGNQVEGAHVRLIAPKSAQSTTYR